MLNKILIVPSVPVLGELFMHLVMKAFVFPGQGAQFSGMGRDLYESSSVAKGLFRHANDILGFDITRVMFEGSLEDLKQTEVTQPAIFLHSVIMAETIGEAFRPDMVAGHSLGEFSALTACGVLSFEKGLDLVFRRAVAMQKACHEKPSAMAAVIGLSDETVEKACSDAKGIVVAANYNCPGQLVISGDTEAVEETCKKLKEQGAKRALMLPVGGAFHSPLMEPAKQKLAVAIEQTPFKDSVCPVYQNVTAKAVKKSNEIKINLISQLTKPVNWTQSIRQMINDGATEFVEVGPGKVLQGLVKKIDRAVSVRSAI